jgi:hypothetical protein
VPVVLRCGWSSWTGLNRRPLPYQGSALPLSYTSLRTPRTSCPRGAWSGRRDSNPRHSAWEADALPTELLPRMAASAAWSGPGRRPGPYDRRWWAGLDSNQRRHTPTDLQSVPFNHSGTYPCRLTPIAVQRWSHPSESNRQPSDYKSDALPVELGWHRHPTVARRAPTPAARQTRVPRAFRQASLALASGRCQHRASTAGAPSGTRGGRSRPRPLPCRAAAPTRRVPTRSGRRRWYRPLARPRTASGRVVGEIRRFRGCESARSACGRS